MKQGMTYDEYRAIKGTLAWEKVKGLLHEIKALHGARFPSRTRGGDRMDQARDKKAEEYEEEVSKFIEKVEGYELFMP